MFKRKHGRAFLGVPIYPLFKAFCLRNPIRFKRHCLRKCIGCLRLLNRVPILLQRIFEASYPYFKGFLEGFLYLLKAFIRGVNPFLRLFRDSYSCFRLFGDSYPFFKAFLGIPILFKGSYPFCVKALCMLFKESALAQQDPFTFGKR